MTNPMINPQPNYSGVTIQIANPTVNAGRPQMPYQSGYMGLGNMTEPAYLNQGVPINPYIAQPYQMGQLPAIQAQPIPQTGQQAYPPQYYLNNYNYQYNNPDEKQPAMALQGNESPKAQEAEKIKNQELGDSAKINDNTKENAAENISPKEAEPQDLSKSQNIIDDLNAREDALKAEEENKQKKNVVALTDEYIKSLENYLNNPNQEIRLMASKEILTRLDEDKSRYDDAALNALLNKMLQDPSKLIRIASLSAFNSQLASGNEYTVHLLQTIQQNPSSDKEDVLQAADILLKMSAGREVKDIPNPAVKEEEQQPQNK